MSERRLALDDGSLVDVLDRLLDAGVYLDGAVLLTLAGVDLVRLDLRLLLASIETLRPSEPFEDDSGPVASVPEPRSVPRTGRSSSRRRQPVERRHAPPPDPDDTTRPDHTARPDHIAPATAEPPIRSASDLAAAAPDEAREEKDDRQAGLAGLVVVVVDIVRQLLERQALRRMDAGTLTGEEVERLGRALMALERQTAELTEFVGGRRRARPRTLTPALDPPRGGRASA